MKLFRFLAVIIIFLIIHGCHSREVQPAAERGILDLRGWDIDAGGPVNLVGAWQFYWNELLESQKASPRLKTASQDEYTIKVRGIWNGFNYSGRSLPGEGYATYRLRVLLDPSFNRPGRGQGFIITPDNDPGSLAETCRSLSMKILAVDTAFQLYINGKKIGSAGTVGKNKREAEPAYKPQVVDFVLCEPEMTVTVEVSNFHHRKGGLDSLILFGTHDQVHQTWENRQSYDNVLFGSIMIMSFYHFGLFFLRRKNRSTLFFAVFCFFIALRNYFTGQYFILNIFPEFPWGQLLRIEYLTHYIPLIAISLFFRSLFPREFPKWLLKTTIIGTTLFTLTLLGPTDFFSHFTRPYQLFLIIVCLIFSVVILLALIRKREGSLALFIGFWALFVTLLNDILYNNYLLDTSILFPLGVFIFIFAQAFILSLLFSKAFSEVEQLTGRFEQLNRDLEKRISDRTRELSARNDQMKRFIHILWHDLLNPFSNLKNMLELLKQDLRLFPELVDYMGASVESGIGIIEMTRKMNALEEKNLQLKLSPHNLAEMIRESHRILFRNFKDKQLELKIFVDDTLSVMVERTSFINSVVNNILSNAFKFSYPGSSIEIRSTENEDTVSLTIRDFGIGIPEKMIEVLFDLDRSTSRKGTEGEKGTGFGMPLVKTFVTAYGGTIKVISHLNSADKNQQGTEVIVTLKKG